MQRDREFLLDILEAAKLAVSYVGEKSKENFLKDIQCQDAVVRRFEIIRRGFPEDIGRYKRFSS